MQNGLRPQLGQKALVGEKDSQLMAFNTSSHNGNIYLFQKDVGDVKEDDAENAKGEHLIFIKLITLIIPNSSY